MPPPKKDSRPLFSARKSGVFWLLVAGGPLGLCGSVVILWHLYLFVTGPRPQPSEAGRRWNVHMVVDALNTDPAAVEAVRSHVDVGMTVNAAVTRVMFEEYADKREGLKRGIIKVVQTDVGESTVLVDVKGLPYRFELRDNQVIFSNSGPKSGQKRE